MIVTARTCFSSVEKNYHYPSVCFVIIPLIRFSTNGNGEKERLIKKLNELEKTPLIGV
jgi:hypothetical protein